MTRELGLNEKRCEKEEKKSWGGREKECESTNVVALKGCGLGMGCVLLLRHGGHGEWNQAKGNDQSGPGPATESRDCGRVNFAQISCLSVILLFDLFRHSPSWTQCTTTVPLKSPLV